MSRKTGSARRRGRARPLLLFVPCIIGGAVLLKLTKTLLKSRVRDEAVNVSVSNNEAGKRRLLEELEGGGVDVLHDLLSKDLDLNAFIRGEHPGLHSDEFVGYSSLCRILDSQQGTPLHWASYFGTVNAMKMLVTAGANLEAEDPSSSKPLHWATMAENTDGVRFLLEAGADVGAIGRRGTTPLHWAAKKGEQNMVRCLLAAGANVGAIDEERKTPLHYVAIGNKTDAMRLLLAAHASLEAVDNDGKTPLHFGATSGEVDALRILVDAGASLEARDSRKKTPLHHAADSGGLDEGVRVLVGAGANLESVDDSQRTPLHYAARSQHKAVADLILAGANVEAIDADGKTPLHYAVEWVLEDSVEAVRALVEAGSNVGVTDAERKTPLHYAAGRNNTDTVRVLLEARASLEAADANGKTPLHCASESAKAEALRILVDAGANVDALDGRGKTPLHYAADSDWNAEGARVLVKAGANVDAVDDQGKTPLYYGAGSKLHSGDNAVKALVEAGACLEIADKHGRTPLHSAIVNRALSVAKYLTGVGASAWTADASGETPLHSAALYAVRDLVEAFVRAGANVQARNEDGQTPLHYAAESGEEGIAQLLVDAGANVDARDGNGRTPLHWAAECGKTEVAAILVKAGADVHVRDNEGRTAAEISADSANAAAVELLPTTIANGHLTSESGPSASPNSAAVQQTHSTEESIAADGEETFEDSQGEASQFSTYTFEVKSGLRLQAQWHHFTSSLTLPTPFDFLRERDDRVVGAIDCDTSAIEAQDTPKEVIRRLPVGAVVANKCCIVSRHITCKGYMRTAVETGSQSPVSLRFYEDPELMQKHARILEGYKKCSYACRFVEMIERDGTIPGCIVLQGSLQLLEDWLRTPAALSTDSKLEMLRSLAVALEGIHSQGYVHHGVCPQSIAFCTEDRTCKFLYLDWMTSVDKEREIEWTSRYAAPELLSTDCMMFYQPYQTAADMWSYGAIAYEVLTGDRIYDQELDEGNLIIRELESDNFLRKLNSVRENRHRHFIKKFLNLDPKKRQTASEARKSSLLRKVAGTGSGGAVNS